MTTTTNLAEVQALAAQHEAEAAALRAQIEAGQLAALQAEDERLREHDLAAVHRYAAEEEDRRKAEAEHRAAFRAAVLSDPVFVAWARYRAARWARTFEADQQMARIQRLGLPVTPPPMVGFASPRLSEDIVELLEEAARGLAQDDQDARHEAREAARRGEV